MHILLPNISIMTTIQRNSFCLNTVITWMIWNINGKINYCLGCMWSPARPIAQVCDLIHINPYTRKFNFTIQDLKHICPILICSGVKPINKNSLIYPNFSYLLRFPISLFYEDISSIANLISSPSLIPNSRLYDWNILIGL